MSCFRDVVVGFCESKAVSSKTESRLQAVRNVIIRRLEDSAKNAANFDRKTLNRFRTMRDSPYKIY